MLEKHLWRDFVGVTSSVGRAWIRCGQHPAADCAGADRAWLGAAGGGLDGGPPRRPEVWRELSRRRGQRYVSGAGGVMLWCVVVAAASVISLQYVDSLWGWAVLRAAFGVSLAPLFVIGEAWINSLPGDAVSRSSGRHLHHELHALSGVGARPDRCGRAGFPVMRS